MLSYQANANSPLTSPKPADVSSASILKSVREQEAQFERLTRELEAERERVSHHLNKQPPHSSSMNSVSHDDSYAWASPLSSQSLHNPHLDSEESADASKMNSNLLDSCLRELEDRGTLNTGYSREEGTMDYMHPDYNQGGPDSYSHQAPYGAGGGNYANTSFDRGSRASLQSTGSNRPRQMGRADDGLGGGVGYSPYGSMSHPDDLRRSPMPRSASPSNAQYYERQSPYHNFPSYQEGPSFGQGPDPYSKYSRHDDSFGSRDDYPGNRNSYNRPADGYRVQGYSDNYDDHPYNNQPSYRDSSLGVNPNMQPHQGGGHSEYLDNGDTSQELPPDGYQDSSYLQQHYSSPPHNGRVDDDQYSDRHNDSLPPRHDDSFQGMRPGDLPGHYSQPSYEQDRYSDVPGQRSSYDQDGPKGSYDVEERPRYRGSYDHEGPGYGGQLLDNSDPQNPGSYDHEGSRGPYINPPVNDPAPPTYQDSYDHEGQGYGDPPLESEEPRYRRSYQDEPPQDPDMYDATPHKFDGLPPVQTDPFADDPFRDRRSYDGSFSALRDDQYNRGPSPNNHGPSSLGGSDIYGDRYYDSRPDDYNSHPYNGEGVGYQGGNAPPYDDYPDSRMYSGEMEQPYYPEDAELARRMEALNVGAPLGDGFHPDDRRTPSIDGRPPVGGFIRSPDLQEVIDYLDYSDDSVKANAAAYLQHLSYNDDAIKAKTRSLNGIRPLIQLLNHELTEVHKNACGALLNLSFGKANDENKRAIKNEGGIPELIRLLRKTDQEDVMDSVTGILWNLSSCEELKQAILDDGLTVLVNVVLVPFSGFNSISQPSQMPWTTVFRNTTGILRNISSAGYEARKRLRECKGLVNALIHTFNKAEDELINCKPIENVVCTLRNLSYRIQEVEDPDFYKKRTLPKAAANANKGANENAGCFGGSNKKNVKKGSVRENSPHVPPPNLPASASEYRALWGNDLILLYLKVLKTSTNPVTMEAAAGAIQNLTACDWAPAVECRAFIRKAKGLPNLVDLLINDSPRVVCAAATALRNLTIDNTNKELIGKYAIQQLVAWLPRDSRHSANKSPDDLMCAVLATLYEVIRSNQDYAASLVQENGLPRLKYINTSDGIFLARTLKINHTILKTLWSFKALHARFAQMGFYEQDFTHSMATPRVDNYRDGKVPSSKHTTPYNTLSRPISAQGYDDNTLSAGRMPRHDDRMNYSHHGGSRQDTDAYLPRTQGKPSPYDRDDRGNYSRERIPPDSIQMDDLGPGYAPLDEPRPHKKPVGGVPLFPNLPPGALESDQPTAQDLSAVPEPLYAQVNKGRRRNDDYSRQEGSGAMIDGSGGQGGADSWV